MLQQHWPLRNNTCVDMHASMSSLSLICGQQLQFAGSIRVTPCHLQQQLLAKIHENKVKSRKQRALCITAASVAQDLRQWAQQRELAAKMRGQAACMH